MIKKLYEKPELEIRDLLPAAHLTTSDVWVKDEDGENDYEM